MSVNAGGTELSVALEAELKMFNTIRGERRKILVIASDFEVSDEEKCLELLSQFAKASVEVVLIGFCDCDKVEHFGEHIRGLRVSRTRIKEISELPLKFIQVYTSIQMQK